MNGFVFCFFDKRIKISDKFFYKEGLWLIVLWLIFLKVYVIKNNNCFWYYICEIRILFLEILKFLGIFSLVFECKSNVIINKNVY